jgi:hypothetical protein
MHIATRRNIPGSKNCAILRRIARMKRRACLRGRGLPLLEARSSERRRAAALAWREGPRVVLWLANLTAEPLTIRMTGIEDARLQASLLDAYGFEHAAASLHAQSSLKRPLEEAEPNLHTLAVARVEAENRQAV